ncbi:GNAT family N-acetyltransferase [Ginsengibacter hankyongi]|nr:GNAT family N-acetyltransferase [Ginsengibacter hankyongi]
MEIKRIEREDVPQVVEVHKDSFKGFFLTELGDHFLTVYYDSVRKDKKAILVGLYNEKELCGFFAATSLSKGFNKQLIINNFLQFSFIGFRLLFTQISSLSRLFKNFTKTHKDFQDDGDYAELLSIGVSVNKQGQGIGKNLLIEFERQMLLRGCSSLSLTTDFNNNEKAIQFYKGLGYEVYYDFIAYPNRRMYRMIKKIA